MQYLKNKVIFLFCIYLQKLEAEDLQIYEVVCLLWMKAEFYADPPVLDESNVFYLLHSFAIKLCL